MREILMGDIGIVIGRRGTYCVRGGAVPPENIVPCSVSAKAAAMPSERLSLTDGSFCWREEFVNLAHASREQEEQAGLWRIHS